MRSNIGFADKTIRFVSAITIEVAVLSKIMTGPLAIALFILAIFLLLTCFRGVCPLYRLLGINTHKNLNDKARIYDFHQRNQTLLKNYLKNYYDRYPEMRERV